MSQRPYTERGTSFQPVLFELPEKEVNDRLRGKRDKAKQLAGLRGRSRSEQNEFKTQLEEFVSKYGSDRHDKIHLTNKDRKEILAIADAILSLRESLQSKSQAVKITISRHAQNNREEFLTAAKNLESSLKSAVLMPDGSNSANERGAPPIVGLEEPVNALLDLWEKATGRRATHNKYETYEKSGEHYYVNTSDQFVELLLPTVRPNCKLQQIESTLKKVTTKRRTAT